jgi:SET family sugar efflux transporter-like MFS transporter
MFRNPLFSIPALVIYLNATGQALLFALVIPTLSLFVAERFEASAFWVGVFFIATAISGIAYAQLMGWWSDKTKDRRPLIALGMAGGAIACLCFAFSSSYWFTMLAGLTFFSLAFASISQIFAHARDYSDNYLGRKDAIMFMSMVRAFSAFAWVGGPALGFIFLDKIGFKGHYLVVMVCYLLGSVSASLFLPSADGFSPAEHAQLPNQKRIIVIALTAFSILYGCNQTYLIALPLFLSRELGVEATWAGWIMGTAAAIEIPVMMFAGWLGTRFSLPPLIRIGAIAPIALYIGVWQSTEVWQLFPLQICNALLIGFIAGIGMTWFQDLMPGKAGAASALYWNSTSFGSILGAITIAIFAELLGYRNVYLINALLALIATILLFFIGAKKQGD